MKPCDKPFPPADIPFRVDRFNRVYIEMSPRETVCRGCGGTVPPFTACICLLERESGSMNFKHW